MRKALRPAIALLAALTVAAGTPAAASTHRTLCCP